ncbi:uncharacterized protein LOC142221953 isoform X2 [Haematobia irritans]|uniref:uncharacterized protein LOC142221953 isoform X2 n=1 Tax=Haematobia irritans TaxID=7368 RepID=UPI003F5072DF
MTSWRYLITLGFLTIWIGITLGDIVVQLNINRPVNDVSDKFISFTMKPEDLYEALDGSHRKSITRMASLLNHSHLKFVGDYYFASETNTKLRNPTKIVWKGFNKWTRAMDWSMIIPVPYAPNDWDPMHAFKILNNSQAVGITDCIWQLGTDFGTSAASDYVNDMKTFDLMVDSFRDTDINWKIMGADISSGSSPDETKNYVEMSKDLNAAFGWIGSSETFLGNSLTGAFNEHDPALKVLFKEKVPVWLTLPKTFNPTLSFMDDDEVQEGLKWAQTMGDAAHNGFNVIFKPISLSDMESPKYSFYVTALYKKVMGSRVFAAKPLSGLFGRSNKLYTHCASSESGGLAFMVINKQSTPLQITVKSMSKLKDNEVWQYALTMSNGEVMLNNNPVSINSTLEPEIKRKQSHSYVHLKTPASSVSFWVLPNANVEHCHYTEVEESSSTEEQSQESTEKKKRYTSSDRLLKELIKEAAAKTSNSGRKKYRHRRSLDPNERHKRFLLDNTAFDGPGVLKKIAEGINLPNLSETAPIKRDVFSPERTKAAMEWLGKLFQEPLNVDLPLLRRSARNSDTYSGPFFMTRDGKKTTVTRRTATVKKPEKTTKRPIEDLEFDEEKYFKNVGVQHEPAYVKFPEGDIYLKNIASVNGDSVPEEELTIEPVKKSKKESKVKAVKTIVNEMKPIRLLPTEFYESLPASPSKSSVGRKMNKGSTLNSLSFDESSEKSANEKDESNVFGSHFEEHGDDHADEEDHIKQTDTDGNSTSESTDEFVQAQMEMSEMKYRKPINEDHDKEEESSHAEDDEGQRASSISSTTRKTRFTNFMGESLLGEGDKEEEEDKSSAKREIESSNSKPKFDETPWWELTALRSKRSVDNSHSWHENMVSKDEDPIVAANEISPRRLRAFEYKVDEAVRSTSKSDNDIDSISKKFVKTIKTQVTKLMDIMSHHVNDWYNSLAKQFEGSEDESTNRI